MDAGTRNQTAPRSGVLAIIPARSGSKGIPHKNVRAFRGKPLIAHSIEQARASHNVDRVIVSTDSDEYASIARAYGAEVPFLRPAEISGDRATDWQAFDHALRWLDEHDEYRPDICVHLRPTYPTRTVADVEAVVDRLAADPTADSVRSVAPAPHTPYKMWRVDPTTGTMQPLLTSDISEFHSVARQALPVVHLQNAAVDAVRARVVLEQRSMVGRRVLAHVMDAVLDIDSELDLERAAWDRTGDAAPVGKTFAIDLDGVIARLTPDNDYTGATPDPSVVELVNQLHDAGNRIVVHSERGAATGVDWTLATRAQLAAWGVKHHGLVLGKPAADYYVDDRMLPLSAIRQWLGRRREDP